MKFVTLNGITRSYLGQLRKPIHYYPRFLKYASDSLRELLFDTLQIINTARVPVDDLYQAKIPADCVDWTKIGIQVGQYIRPLIEKESLNRLANIDTSDGTQITYPAPQYADDWVGTLQWQGVNTNTNGENVGGYYGLGAGSEPDTFKFIPERNVIQLNQNLQDSKIVIEYISDGTYTNAATKIPPYAQKTIEAYMDWQYKLHSRTFDKGDSDRAEIYFYKQHGILRARKNNLTPELVERIINRHRKASIQ